jgi:hypothetical protein
MAETAIRPQSAALASPPSTTDHDHFIVVCAITAQQITQQRGPCQCEVIWGKVLEKLLGQLSAFGLAPIGHTALNLFLLQAGLDKWLPFSPPWNADFASTVFSRRRRSSFHDLHLFCGGKQCI